MNLAELAGYLRLPEKPLQKLAEQGGLPARQVGGEWRFLKDAVRAWLGHAGDVDPVPPKPGTAATILQSAAFIDDEDDLQEQLKLLRGYREESRR
jgi:excisionase family DNA binding protein